jgi:hypothetical protein
MWMLQRCACSFAMVFENENVFEAAISFQVNDAVAEGPEHVLNAFVGHVGKCLPVVWRLDNHFVRADSIHAVVHAFRTPVEVAFDSQGGILVGHHAHRPARPITLV